ncbi:hypothetical protein CJ030_MR7G007540 [Morella rubra]|uniref:Pentatricopeptide repeat-containing protein, mitochondrial n=1 Tax=Morella rubra TaxID=262757 RepID=A0A6A1V4D7_9ROSI|nr:hypothetical protein CJ030_MR7G007540 [Morella rubra]
MAGRILVQARDPAKLSMDIQNAIEERRFNDTWKFYEQHIQMENFPRKSVVSKLLTSFVESLDVQWLEKAYGLVEQAFEEAPRAYLAVELILEISYLFQDGMVDPRKKSNAPLIAMKPNNTAVNIALAGCLLFGTTRKAEQLLDMMPRVGVKFDANLLIVMAHIYSGGTGLKSMGVEL